jgi:hypothetical protein
MLVAVCLLASCTPEAIEPLNAGTASDPNGLLTTDGGGSHDPNGGGLAADPNGYGLDADPNGR